MNRITNLNLTYLLSNIHVTARLVYAFPYSETGASTAGSNRANLNAFHNLNDGFADEIGPVRDLVRADLVSIIRYRGVQGSSSGTISQGYNESSARRLNISNIYQDDILNPNLNNMGNQHEMGHSMGMAHGRDDSSLVPHHTIPFAYGFCAPASNVRTWNQFQCGPFVNLYSNPDILSENLQEPMGVSHSIDPLNSADGARAQNITAPIIARFRTGTPQYPDCDGNGLLDIAEIAHGAWDLNADEIPDSCQINSDPSLDCDMNGVLDQFETEWSVDMSYTGNIPTANNSIVLTTHRLPDSDLNVSASIKARYAVASPEIDVFVNDVYVGSLYANGIWADCDANNADTLTIPLGSIPSSVNGKITVELTGHLLAEFGPPCIGSNASIGVSFQSVSPVDDDRDGTLNCDDLSCNMADLDENGILDFFDVNEFMALYTAQDPQADTAVPLGVWDFFDLNNFLNAYNAGCP